MTKPLLPKTVWAIALRTPNKTLYFTANGFEDCSEGKGQPLTASSFTAACTMHDLQANGQGVIREMPFDWLMGGES